MIELGLHLTEFGPSNGGPSLIRAKLGPDKAEPGLQVQIRPLHGCIRHQVTVTESGP